MSFIYRPGTLMEVLDENYQPAGDVTIEMFLRHDNAYKVRWTYETGEFEFIKVPEWRLKRKECVKPLNIKNSC